MDELQLHDLANKWANPKLKELVKQKLYRHSLMIFGQEGYFISIKEERIVKEKIR